VSAESKSQTSIEGHSIAHIVCLLAKSLSQQNSDLNETQSNKPRELNRRRSLRVSIDRTSALRLYKSCDENAVSCPLAR
jgi:hypothetical protein